MDWYSMDMGVPDPEKPCIIKKHTGSYKTAIFKILDNKGIWVTDKGFCFIKQVSHWAYITPPVE